MRLFLQVNVRLRTLWARSHLAVVGLKMVPIILIGLVLLVQLLVIKLDHPLTTPMEPNKVTTI